jgi:hypothetical protein
MQTKRTSAQQHAKSQHLLHPASVAVIGDSTRAGSFDERELMNLRY